MSGRPQLGVWRLRAEIGWARLLLRLVTVRGVTTARPELHEFLFDRWYPLSEAYRRRGDLERAARAHARAEWHHRQWRGDDPPPLAAAAANPRPRRPKLTWAVTGKPEPPDAG